MGSSSADRRRSLARALLLALAVALAAWTILFSVCWMIAARPPVTVELGFDAPQYLASEHAMVLATVTPGSPAERMGLRPGDRLVAIDGTPLENADSQEAAWTRHKPGDRVSLTVIHAGGRAPVELTGRFRATRGTGLGDLGDELRYVFPVPFVLVGLTVLFLRVEDRNVWLLALLLVSFVTPSAVSIGFRQITPSLRPLVLAYNALFIGLIGPLCYWFFAVFPTRSPLDRRLPWFKWATTAVGLWFAMEGLAEGRLKLPGALASAVGDPGSNWLPFWFEFPLLVLGLVSLALNFFTTRGGETRRKIRVIFWGTIIGLTPPLAALGANRAIGFAAPAWLSTFNAAVIFLFPLSFAYAVVKHRVLDIPVLLRRSARYLLVQRGCAVSLSLVSIGLTLLFAFSLATRLQPVVDVTGPSGIMLGAVFGTVVLWGGLRIHRRVSERIDRLFFRSAYDARMILEDLTEQTRAATDRKELALLLERHVRDALRPAWLAVCLTDADGRLQAIAGSPPPDLCADERLLRELAEHPEPREFSGHSPDVHGMSADCLVPIVGRSRALAGLLVLGTRLSEEPYSGEDTRLLATVAAQAGTALDNIRFAEDLAARIERDRHAAREMEIARQVQARLLPQAAPHLRTAECAAQCIQAKAVGGDYYDFLELGEDRVGFVLADVSGKGVHAALLSASLQAHLRSQAAVAPLDPVGLLRRVNAILWTSTAPQHYATLFFGIYDDRARRLVYVNCGHNPPVLLRADGCVERLAVTAPVVGLFEQWDCTAGETALAADDLLVVFSDGVTDALHGDEEFGDTRFIELLQTLRRCPPARTVATVLERVQSFTSGDQTDDLTLLVARAT